MLTSLTTLGVLVLITLLAAAGAVTLAASNQERRRHALTVLKALFSGLLGTGGVFVVILRLHQSGLL